MDSCGVNRELTCEKMGSYTRCGSKMGMGGVSSAFECKKKGRTYTLQDKSGGKLWIQFRQRGRTHTLQVEKGQGRHEYWI